MLVVAKRIERQLGRQPASRWAPRPIDIDLLHWDDNKLNSATLTLPHPDIIQRSFVLTPLMHLRPDLVVEQDDKKQTLLDWSREQQTIPLFMAIVNLTPDSFSGDSSHLCLDENYFLTLFENGAHIIDLGAESTRPGADSIDHETEWKRLEPALRKLSETFEDKLLKPMISIDSRNPQTIERALAYGIDMINDVGGLSHPDMISLVRASGCSVVAMHAVTVPVDHSKNLPVDVDVCLQMQSWLKEKIDYWLDCGIKLEQIIFDPGIGFGKSAPQSFELLRNLSSFKSLGVRVLAGHSRKSFMNVFTERPFTERDPETLGISIALSQLGTDFIRVHNIDAHLRAYRGWSHIRGY